VSSVPDEQSSEVGGLQNTFTNLGASIGTALAGSILIAVLTMSFIQGVVANPDVPEEVKTRTSTELVDGIPFVSDADLETAMLNAGVNPELTQSVVDVNAEARANGLKAALAVLGGIALLALFFANRIPRRQPGAPAEATA